MSDPSAIAFSPSIRGDLDRLAGHGAAQIVRDARLRLVRDALLAIVPVFPVASVGAVVAMLFGASPLIVAVAGLVLPVMAFVALAGVRILRFRARRGEALNWIDREGALKGRMRTADSYLAAAETSAFEQAAIADAAGHLPSGVRPSQGADKALFNLPAHVISIVLCSALVSVTAILMALLWRSAVEDGADPRISPATAIASALNIREGMRAAQGNDSSDAQSADAAEAAATAGSRDGNGARSAGGGGAGTNKAPDSGTMSNGVAGAGDAGVAADGREGVGTRSPDRGAVSDRAEPSGSDARDESGPSADRDAQSGGQSAAGNAGAHEAPPIASANSGARTQSQPAQSGQARKAGEDRNRPPQSQTREGSQSQAQPGRGQRSQNGNGSNSSSSEQKASFGVSGLLLGVPMADQLTGTRNPGPARRRTLDGEPGPASATGTPAQVRGTGSGRTGTQPQPARSPRETRLLSDWFARGGPK